MCGSGGLFAWPPRSWRRGAQRPYLSRMGPMCVLGQMVRSSAQACRAAQEQAAGWRGPRAGVPPAAGPAENTFQAGGGREARSGEGRRTRGGEGLRGRAGAWRLSRWGLWVTHLNVPRQPHVAQESPRGKTRTVGRVKPGHGQRQAQAPHHGRGSPSGWEAWRQGMRWEAG